jgi:hypothetical protein
MGLPNDAKAGLCLAMPKPSKEEAELERIAKNLLAMPHTDRDKTKFKTRKKKPRKLKLKRIK